MINWTVRIKNENFWVALIPAVMLLVEQVMHLCGVELDLNGLQAQLVAIVGTVFSILAILGVVNDPTTKGLSDSKLAMTYEKPKED